MDQRRIHVTAGSRLHFGMLSFGQPGLRQFGGAGAMISAPSLRLTVTSSDRVRVQGPLADRVEQFVERLSRHAAWWRKSEAFCVMVEEAPPQHAGLGSGTQLGMALARGLAAWFSAPTQTAESLGQAVNRGRRSSVGIHGACLGGLIVEAGKLRDEEISPLVTRMALAEEWRFVLLSPDTPAGLSGEAERRAFQRLPPVPLATTASLCRELVCELVPAAVGRDFDRFAESLYRYGQLAGGCFAAQQGGIYAHPAIERLVRHCRDAGVRGVGQSSWGPTVYALCRAPREAAELVDSLTSAGLLGGHQALIAEPDNEGIGLVSLEC